MFRVLNYVRQVACFHVTALTQPGEHRLTTGVLLAQGCMFTEVLESRFSLAWNQIFLISFGARTYYPQER